MSTPKSRMAMGLPGATQPIYQAMREAGVTEARASRNVPWISEAADGTVVFNLIARHIERRDGEIIARIDPRRWGEYGLNLQKSQDVIDGLARQIGLYIRVVIVERDRGATRGRFDEQPWLVTQKGNDFILRRRPVEPSGPGTAEEFTQRMLRIYTDGRDQIGYSAHRFRGKVVRDGGVKAAKYWLRPGSSATEGFIRLLDHGRPDLSMEAVVLEPRWSHLFTQAELAIASERLSAIAHSPPPATRVKRPLTSFPDELEPGQVFEEGTRKTVRINAYERDPAARAQCIGHYGARCYVCDFDFERAYGPLGEGYIHVHHVVALARGGRVKTDPILDLRPVCPNCHAMLHRVDPPLPISELKKLLRRSGPKRRGRRQ